MKIDNQSLLGSGTVTSDASVQCSTTAMGHNWWIQYLKGKDTPLFDFFGEKNLF